MSSNNKSQSPKSFYYIHPALEILPQYHKALLPSTSLSILQFLKFPFPSVAIGFTHNFSTMELFSHLSPWRCWSHLEDTSPRAWHSCISAGHLYCFTISRLQVNCVPCQQMDLSLSTTVGYHLLDRGSGPMSHPGVMGSSRSWVAEKKTDVEECTHGHCRWDLSSTVSNALVQQDWRIYQWWRHHSPYMISHKPVALWCTPEWDAGSSPAWPCTWCSHSLHRGWKYGLHGFYWVGIQSSSCWLIWE